MILEGIVTTTNADQTVNISPMGPLVEAEAFTRFVLRPFQTSRTYENLKRSGVGVLHVTDDVQMFVDGALRDFSQLPATVPATTVDGFVLADCCRFFEFKVEKIDDTNERTEISCSITHQEEKRPFWGFNRAKHAVLEAAIFATRIHLMDFDDLRKEFESLSRIVEKTAGPSERTAFEKLLEFVNRIQADAGP